MRLVENTQLLVEKRRLYPKDVEQKNFKGKFDSGVAILSDKLPIDIFHSDRQVVCEDSKKKIKIFIEL